MEHNSVTIRIELDNAAWQNEDGTLSATAVGKAIREAATWIQGAISHGEGLHTEYPHYRQAFDNVIHDENGNTSGRLALGYEGEVIES